MTPLALRLDRSSARPLGVQLADAVRDRVTDGRLPPGERLPSSRALAAELGVARTVVEQAWAQLVAEGWLEGRHGSGHLRGRRSQRSRTRAPAPARAGGTGRAAAGPPRHRHPVDRPAARGRLAPGLARRRGRHPAARVRRPARPARAARRDRGTGWSATRGLDVDPDDVRITAGTTDGLRHLLSALGPGPVGVEDPGYRAAVATVGGHGASGRRPAARRGRSRPGRSRGGVRHAGAPAPARRHDVRGRAPGAAGRGRPRGGHGARRGRLRLGVPLRRGTDPGAGGLDRERVAYLGTTSKSVSPSLRLGWLVPPPGLGERIDAQRARTHDAASWPVQRALPLPAARRVRRPRRALGAAHLRGAGSAGRRGPGRAPRRARSPACTRPCPCPRPPPGGPERRRSREGFDVPLLADYCRSAAPARAGAGLRRLHRRRARPGAGRRGGSDRVTRVGYPCCASYAA